MENQTEDRTRSNGLVQEMLTARLIGKLTALEIAVTLLLEQRSDLNELARKADKVLVGRERRDGGVSGNAGDTDFMMMAYECARLHLEKFFTTAQSDRDARLCPPSDRLS